MIDDDRQQGNHREETLALRASIDNDAAHIDRWPAEAWQQFGTLRNLVDNTFRTNEMMQDDVDNTAEHEPIDIATATPRTLDCLRRFALRQLDANQVVRECAASGILGDLVHTIDLLHNDDIVAQLAPAVNAFLLTATDKEIQKTFGLDIACACGRFE